MRSYALVALLATSLLFISADASRQLAQDALSNSNGCLNTIPKCEAGACATRNIMGVARWICLRCRGGYEPVVTADGQDNIVQCVCPRGFFEEAGANSCTRCAQNQFCPGGDKVENPTSRGTNNTCGDNLVTRNTGARSQSDCVAPAGYARTSPTSGSPCARSEYAPQFNRLSKCLRCQSGLEEPSSSGLTDGQRSTKKAVCKIPPGKFMSQGLVRICPQGFFRQNWVDFDDAVGTLCLPCRPGITTAGAGKGLPSDCNVVLPGYGVGDPVSDYEGPAPADIPDLPAADNQQGLPAGSLCDIGFYSKEGKCVACPYETVTTVKGAKSVEECVVPPGYHTPKVQDVTTDMVACGSGTFREGWVMFSDPRASTCTECGTNIQSTPRDLDENPKVANGSLTRATSASCFITDGQGMIAQGANKFAAQDCPINTYGAAGIVYGWAAAPCKPCARNMITDGAVKVNNSDVCVNDDGFGYASEGASRCAPGFYSAKGSRKPCQQCPAGRTTGTLQSEQRFISQCYVMPSHGVVNSSSNGTDAFNPNTDLPADEQAALSVLECPIGYYSAGGSVNNVATKCTQCPAGSSTTEPGRTSEADCNVCIAGHGKENGVGPCRPCPYGTFQPGGLTTCQACPSSDFYTPVDGNGTIFNSAGTTAYPASHGAEACFPIKSQLSPEAGQAYIAPGTTSYDLYTVADAATLAACVSLCGDNQCCMAQWDAEAGKCRTAKLDAASSEAATGKQIVYKLPPSSLGSASSVGEGEAAVKGKMMSSGYYAHCTVPAADAAKWAAAGSDLDATARTFATAAVEIVSTRAECKKLCDNSNVCWGFVFDAAAGKCSFRGGVDALKTRSFFSVPTAVADGLAQFKW